MGDKGIARQKGQMMPAYEDIVALVHRQLSSGKATFSIGVMGAIAEYFSIAKSQDYFLTKSGGTAITKGGGILIDLPQDVCVTAYESVSGQGGRWSQGVIFSCPADNARLGLSKGLSMIGQDKDALRTQDKIASLFDLGLGIDHFSFAIRTLNKNLIAKLIDAKGCDLFINAPNTLKAVMALEPSRVVQTKFGRIEATNPFMDLQGPHTHLVPNMINTSTLHAATLPVPAGHVVGLTMLPPSPWMSVAGLSRKFNWKAYDDFQPIFEIFAPHELRNEKARLIDAITSGISPENYEIANNKPARLQARATLRQLQKTTPHSNNLKDWFIKLDRTGWVEQ